MSFGASPSNHLSCQKLVRASLPIVKLVHSWNSGLTFVVGNSDRESVADARMASTIGHIPRVKQAGPCSSPRATSGAMNAGMPPRGHVRGVRPDDALAQPPAAAPGRDVGEAPPGANSRKGSRGRACRRALGRTLRRRRRARNARSAGPSATAGPHADARSAGTFQCGLGEHADVSSAGRSYPASDPAGAHSAGRSAAAGKHAAASSAEGSAAVGEQDDAPSVAPDPLVASQSSRTVDTVEGGGSKRQRARVEMGGEGPPPRRALAAVLQGRSHAACSPRSRFPPPSRLHRQRAAEPPLPTTSRSCTPRRAAGACHDREL
ncbi:mucin-1-like [Panicum virgatum]|uniref:mucin-1-like n=1 Tax=Panicum virgatum TaxID=38727 RepID=UPI0019D62E46|nr:mucin-1-like [Panicum virgatum]